jgi:hypothetical protein
LLEEEEEEEENLLKTERKLYEAPTHCRILPNSKAAGDEGVRISSS